MADLRKELLPCPFCGDMPEINARLTMVSCVRCNASGPDWMRINGCANLGDAWNRRALAAQPAPSEDEALGWEPAEVFAYAWMNDENEWCFSERKPSFVAEFRLKRLGLVGASQPASVGADAEAVEALQAAVNACDRPIFTEKAEAAASWAAVSFVQSYGKQVLRRLDGTGGE